MGEQKNNRIMNKPIRNGMNHQQQQRLLQHNSLQSSIGDTASTEDFRSDSNSATRDFFKSYVPRLEMAVQSGELDHDWDDPSLDLQDLEVVIRQPSPMQQTQNSSHAPITSMKDQTLEELEFLVNELKKKSSYGEKLISIMLSGLQKTLGQYGYQGFLLGKLPPTWMPIVKMNDINCPYIEFLVKSDQADQDPESQLSDYSNRHLAYSKYILDYLSEITKNSKPQHRKASTSLIQSTPKRQSSSDSAKQSQDLNDSRRIQPARACRASLPKNSRLHN